VKYATNTYDHYDPSYNLQRKYNTKEPVALLNRALRFSENFISKEDAVAVRNYIAGGEPIDMIIVFNLGVLHSGESKLPKLVRKSIKAVVFLIVAADSIDLGYEGRAFSYLDSAKDIIVAIEKKA
jgi:hypothetical protein